MEKKQNFNEICEKNGIKIFTGIIMDHCPSDIGLIDPLDFIEYCSINEIKSVVLSYTFVDTEEIDIEQVKTKLRRFFNKKMQEYPYSETFLPKLITQDYFLPALSDALEKLNQEDFGFERTGNDDGPELVEAWAVHSGCRIHTNVYEKADGQDNAPITEKDVLNKYARLINVKLENLLIEARKESQQRIKEQEEKTIAEIEEIIKNNDGLINLTTQKARNDYADRIQIIFQEEKGCDWLTKKQVRAIVEHRYVKLTEKADSVKFYKPI